MAKNDVSTGIDNFKNYEEKIKTSSDKELKMFDNFYESVKNHAENHKSSTINNLRESKESLSNLKASADKLKDSVFYHEETVIVDRQSIISQTEAKVHRENRNILDFEYNQADERIDSLDYLNKALTQTKFNFFNQFRSNYGNLIFDNDILYAYFQNKVKAFDLVLNKYHGQIKESFKTLDNEINDMDYEISLLIQEKNSQLHTINRFYDQEIKNYLDNQLTFSVEDDPTTLTMQALLSDKVAQLDSFKAHQDIQEEKVKQILHDEYKEIYNKTLDRLLRRKGNLLIEDTTFFYHPDETILKLKQEIVVAERDESVVLKELIKKYNKAIKYKKEKVECEKKAKSLTKSFLKLKKEIFLEYQIDSRDLIFKLEKFFKLYLELIKIDPFLAQIIGDNSTKIIKDEINFLSILKVNKEHKINVNFDIKTLKLKQKINEVEAKLAYNSESLMIQQDIELLETIKDIQLFFVDHQYDSTIIMNSLTKEKYQIEKLETAINHHMEYLVKTSNVNRKFLSIITQILEANTRTEETHNIHVVEAAAKVKLALKEYDILALHFNTMYENEKRFLVMQSNRVSEETKINNEFILTTFDNQMRFAREQIALANDEYKLRVEAILTAINEERNYYYDIINHKLRTYKDREKTISDDYQAKLYHDTLLLTENPGRPIRKALEKQVAINKRNHDNLIDAIETEIDSDMVIADTKRRLRELDGHFEVALDDAKTMRDDTIKEMSELFHDAKNKYEALKPYLENKVNPLDPTFFNTLESIKKRHNYKLKAAEVELEEKTKELMDNYLHIFFEEQPHVNPALYISNIEQLEEERKLIKSEYSNKLSFSETDYHNKLKILNNEARNIIQKIETNRNQNLTKHLKSINQKRSELDILDKQFENSKEKLSTSFRKEIQIITDEYNQSLVKNQKHYKNLSNAFDTILDSYYPYLKTASNNRAIKHIVRKTEKKVNQSQKAETKKIIKANKKIDLLIG